jgi:hypothetical protein
MHVKLLFLAWFVTEHGACPEGRALLGDGHLNVGRFDQHWTIERFYFPESTEAVERQLSPEAVAALVVPGDSNLVTWLKGLKEAGTATTDPRQMSKK